MWIFYAVGSAFFAGVTSVLAKCGINKTDSSVATAIRTAIILIFTWLIVLLSGSFRGLFKIDAKTVLFLFFSGISTGLSWLCYFKALKVGDINKVVPVDKLSTVLTILFAMLFLGEEISVGKIAAMLFMTGGILLMIEKKDAANQKQKEDKGWFLYAAGSAFFAALTAILSKIGISHVDSNLGSAIRTIVVLFMAWLMVFIGGKTEKIREIPPKEFLYICCSSIATGISWLCYYKALQDGPVSVVVSIDKLSILFTIVFSYFIFGEKLQKKEGTGFQLLLFGTVMIAIL